MITRRRLYEVRFEPPVGTVTFSYRFPELGELISDERGTIIELRAVFITYSADATVASREPLISLRSRNIIAGSTEMYTADLMVASTTHNITFTGWAGATFGTVLNTSVRPLAKIAEPGDILIYQTVSAGPADQVLGTLRYRVVEP